MSPCRCTSLVISMTTALCRRMRPSLVWENLRLAFRFCLPKTTKKKLWKAVSQTVFLSAIGGRGSNMVSAIHSEHTAHHCTHLTWIAHNLTRHEILLNKNAYLFVLHIQDLRGWAFLSLFSLCSLDPLVPHPGISEENLNSHIPHIPHIHTPSSMGRILSGRKWKRQRRQRKNWKNKDIKTSNSRPLLGRPKNWFFCLGMSQHVSTLNTSWLKSWLTEMWLSR